MKTINTLKIIYLTILPTLTYFSASAQTNANLAEAKKAIAASNAVYFEGFARGNPSLFANRYAPDCWIMPANEPSLCGPDAAPSFFRTAYNRGVRNGKLITIDVYGVSKDVVAEVGFYRLINADKKQFDEGKYLVLWKKAANSWKMFRACFNSDHPAKN